jgi:hypothetical protein
MSISVRPLSLQFSLCASASLREPSFPFLIQIPLGYVSGGSALSHAGVRSSG